MNTVDMLPNLMNLSMLPPAQDMIGAPKGKRKLEALQAHQERRQIDFDQFEVTETPIPEVFGDRPNAVLRAPGFAPALRMLSAMLSKVVLDMIGTEPLPDEGRRVVLDDEEEDAPAGSISVSKQGAFFEIWQPFFWLKDRKLLGRIASQARAPDLHGLLITGESSNFVSNPFKHPLTNEVMAELRAFLTTYLAARGLPADQAMIDDYYKNTSILKEYFSGYTSHEYISRSVFTHLLTVRPKQPSSTPNDVLMVCTGMSNGGDIMMQGIVACPFFSATHRGLGKLVVMYMEERTRKEGVKLRVDPHTQSPEWRDFLASKTFTRDLNGRKLRPNGYKSSDSSLSDDE